MIDRQHGRILFECDSCPETFEGGKGETFEEVWARAKDEGWKARKVGHDWAHGCPECEV